MPPRPAPRQPSYDPGLHMQSNRGNFGNYVLRDGVNMIVKKPSWNKTETVFRPYPSLSYEDSTQFLPYRLDPSGRNVFGHWIRRYDCAWCVGNPAHTFLLNDPGTNPSVYDPWLTPLGVLYRAVESACKRGQGRPEWYPLREGASGRGKALRAPSEVYLMQGILMRYESNNLYGPGKTPPGWGKSPPCMLMLSSGIGKELIRQLSLEHEDFRGDPADFENRYVNGDPVSPKHGRYLHFFQKGFDPRQRYLSHPTTRTSAAPSLDDMVGSSGGRGDRFAESDDIGFDLFMTKDLDGLPAAFTDKGTEIAKSKWQYWEDILWFPTEVEQAHLLFKIFPVSACLYAFDGVNQDWIPEDARRRAANAVSAAVPGFLPGGLPVTSCFGNPLAPSGRDLPQQPGVSADRAAPVSPLPPSPPPSSPSTLNQAPTGPTTDSPSAKPTDGGMDAIFGDPEVDESVPTGSVDDGVSDGGFGFDPRPADPPAPAPTTDLKKTQQSIARMAAARAAARAAAGDKK